MGKNNQNSNPVMRKDQGATCEYLTDKDGHPHLGVISNTLRPAVLKAAINILIGVLAIHKLTFPVGVRKVCVVNSLSCTLFGVITPT